MIRIRPTDQEGADQSLGENNLRAALEAVNRDGIVVLEDVVDPDHVERLGARMKQEMETVRSRRPIGVDVPLTDFTEENGATEVWLGSHRETRRLVPGDDNYEQMLAEHRERDRIAQMTAKKGSLVVRDMRIYHAGMPNRTDELRQMISMVYNRYFYRVLLWMPFARGIEDFFEHPELQAMCTFFDGEKSGLDYEYRRRQQGLPEAHQLPGVVVGEELSSDDDGRKRPHWG